jgi:hypothetical protein
VFESVEFLEHKCPGALVDGLSFNVGVLIISGLFLN